MSKINMSEEGMSKSIDKTVQGEMPKVIPGERNSPIFTGERIIEFVEVYELITSRNNSREKTLLFPFYCDKTIQEKIKKTVSYENREWSDFKKMLLRKFKEKIMDDPLEPLKLLVSKGIGDSDYFSFLDEFEYEVNKLELEGEISPSQKSTYFIKALPQDLVSQKGEEIYNGDKLLEYSVLKEKFSKLCSAKDRLQKIRSDIKTNNSEGFTNEKSGYSKNQIDELIKGMSALTILYKSNIENQVNPNQNSTFQKYGKINCIYCEGEHLKRDCKELDSDLKSGWVKIGERGMITNPQGKELLPNWGKGGIKQRVDKVATNRSISIDRNIAEIRNDFISCDQKIIDNYNVIYKEEFNQLINNFAAKRNLLDYPVSQKDSQKKQKTQETEKTIHRKPEDIPLAELTKEIAADKMAPKENYVDFFNEEPYKVKSKVVKDGLLDVLTSKIKELKIQVSLEELASVSPMIRKSINDEFKLRRVADVR
ncbi:hypothetical protein AYI69_g8076 [Smittium culicis]|uniref:Retrotransposon gag domain-containing protein n=1 Tax=Smittium culicis TaxID=133412 RepID=A0A1R1XMH4_9FUNG|nr:hypothetical protein AYI69_g8076 [Smittium culicis]